MDFVREMLREVEGKKEIAPEILELIQPSVALLDLGLPLGVLYEHCRWSIRDLLRRMHPDQYKGATTSVMRSALKTVSDAFDLIKDQEVFAEALSAAREYRGYQRLGERSLRGRIQSLEDTIADLNAKSRHHQAAHQEEAVYLKGRFEAHLRRLDEGQKKREEFFLAQEAKLRFGEWVQKYLAGHRMRFSSRSGSIRPITGSMRLVVVSFAFSFSASPVKKRKSEMHKTYRGEIRRLKRKRKTMLPVSKSLRGFITAHNLAAIPVVELLERGKSSGFALPAIRWSFAHALREMGLTCMGRKDSQNVVRESLFGTWSEAARMRYQEALEQIRRGLDGLYVSKAAILPQRITIEDQVFNGDAVNKACLYLLGTADPATAFLHHHIPAPGTPSPRLQAADTLLPEIEPFVSPGRAIVALPAVKPFTLIPKSPDSEWDVLIEKKELLERSRSTLFLSHIILDVE